MDDGTMWMLWAVWVTAAASLLTAVASLMAAKNVSKQIDRQEKRDAVQYVRDLMEEKGVPLTEIEAERMWEELKEKFDG